MILSLSFTNLGHNKVGDEGRKALDVALAANKNKMDEVLDYKSLIEIQDSDITPPPSVPTTMQNRSIHRHTPPRVDPAEIVCIHRRVGDIPVWNIPSLHQKETVLKLKVETASSMFRRVLLVRKGIGRCLVSVCCVVLENKNTKEYALICGYWERLIIKYVDFTFRVNYIH